MIDLSWITTSGTAILMVIITSIGIYCALILFTRVAGLRSFSKMSSFDFAVTVAFGSVIATVISAKDPPLVQGITALLSLFVLQIVVARLRNKIPFISKIVDNAPILLMDGTDIKEDNLKRAQVTHDDLRAKLREANVTQLNQVKAVVMEATGDISVLHHFDEDHHLDDQILKNVRGWENE